MKSQWIKELEMKFYAIHLLLQTQIISAKSATVLCKVSLLFCSKRYCIWTSSHRYCIKELYLNSSRRIIKMLTAKQREQIRHIFLACGKACDSNLFFARMCRFLLTFGYDL